jgi:hypothetical protein
MPSTGGMLMKIFLKINLILLAVLLTVASGFFMSCDAEVKEGDSVAESTDSAESKTDATTAAETYEAIDPNKSKIEYLNEKSDFVFKLLQTVSPEELEEHSAEKTDYGYVIKMEQFVFIDYVDRAGTMETYKWEYRLTQNADGEYRVTEIYTDSPLALIGGIMLETKSDVIEERFLQSGFHVVRDDESITAFSDDAIVKISRTGGISATIAVVVGEE